MAKKNCMKLLAIIAVAIAMFSTVMIVNDSTDDSEAYTEVNSGASLYIGLKYRVTDRSDNSIKDMTLSACSGATVYTSSSYTTTISVGGSMSTYSGNDKYIYFVPTSTSVSFDISYHQTGNIFNDTYHWRPTFTASQRTVTFYASVYDESPQSPASGSVYMTSGSSTSNTSTSTSRVSLTVSPGATVTYHSSGNTGDHLYRWVERGYSSYPLGTSTTYSVTVPADWDPNDNELVTDIQAWYRPNEYTLTLNPNGGQINGSTSSVTRTVGYGMYYGGGYSDPTGAELPTPTRTNYTFLGWYTSSSGGTQKTATDIYQTLGNSTLYAHWSAPTNYNITIYKGNWGSFKLLSDGTTYTSNSHIYSIPAGTTIDVDWYGKSAVTGTNYTTTYTNYEYQMASSLYGTSLGDSVTVSGNASYYPSSQMSARTTYSFEITYDANSGSGAPSSYSTTVSYNGEYDSTKKANIALSSTTPTRSNYTFLGWATSSSATSATYQAGQTYQFSPGTTPLYAVWSLNVMYTQTLEGPMIDGTTATLTASGYSPISVSYSDSTSKSVSVAPGTTITLSTSSTAVGYHFDKWIFTSEQNSNSTDNPYTYTASSNRTVWAHYEANAYTVTFDANGGSVSENSKTVYYKSAYGAMPTPTRTNYTFAGWYTDPTNGTQVTSETIMTQTSNHTLYAHWLQYVTAGAQAGQAIGSWVSISATGFQTQTQYYNGSNQGSITLYVPSGTDVTYTASTTDGYTFSKWVNQSSQAEILTNPMIREVTIDETWIPQYIPDTLTVTFDPDGGTVSPTTKTVTMGQVYGGLPTPTKTGYDFVGWYETPAMSGTNIPNQITASSIVSYPSNHTLIAHWTIKTFTVTIDVNDQSYGSVSQGQVLNVPYNSTITVSDDTIAINGTTVSATPATAVVKYTYSFSNWSNTGGSITDDRTVTANFARTPNTFQASVTVPATFTGCTATISDGTSGNQRTATAGTTQTITVAYDMPVVYTATRSTGWAFANWLQHGTDTQLSTDNPLNVYHEVAGDLSLDANFSNKNWNVMLQVMSGGGTSSVTAYLGASTLGTVSPGNSATYSVLEGQTVTFSADRQPGYKFLGYKTTTGGSYVSTNISYSREINDDTNIYAYFDIDDSNYNIYFIDGSTNLGLGTISPNSTTKIAGTILTVSDNTIKVGNTVVATATVSNNETSYFAGWKYNDVMQSNNASITVYGSMNIYAIFEYRQSFTVTYNANGGTVWEPTKTVYQGWVYGDPPHSNRAGHDLVGWFTAPTGGTQILPSTVVDLSANQTLYAHWQAKNCVVTFDANGGIVSPTSATVTWGQAYGNLPTPTRAGYVFTGWFTNSVDGTEVTSSTVVETSENHTIYAHWTGAQYTITFDPTDGQVDPISKQVINGGQYGNLPTPIYEGHDFAGWFTASTGGTQITETTTVNLTDNQTLYAQWTVKPQYTAYVSVPAEFTGCSATVSDGVGAPATAYAGQTVSITTFYDSQITYTATGASPYVFAYWSVLGSGQLGSSNPIVFEGLTSSGLSLVANFSQTTYTLTVSVSGGSEQCSVMTHAGSNELGTTYTGNSSTYTIAENTGVGLYAETKPGFKFSGYKTDPSSQSYVSTDVNYSVTMDQNRTVYAYFEVDNSNYNVYFEEVPSFSYGYVSSASALVSAGSTIHVNGNSIMELTQTLSTATARSDDYYFKGWSLTNDTSGTIMYEGQEFIVFGETTLYAIFAQRQGFEITFDPNGGTVSTQSKIVYQGSTYGELPTPTWVGRQFVGWFDAVSGGNQISSATTVDLQGNITLYAHWNVLSYTASVYVPTQFTGCSATVSGSNNQSATATAGNTATITVSYEDQVTYTASYGNSNFIFAYWSIPGNPTPLSSDNPAYVYNQTSGNLSWTANFTRTMYDVTVNVVAGAGTSSVTTHIGVSELGTLVSGEHDTYQIPEGAVGVFSAQPAPGYTFLGFKNTPDDATFVSTSENYGVTVTSTLTLYAYFAQDSNNYTMYLFTGPNMGMGTVSPSQIQRPSGTQFEIDGNTLTIAGDAVITATPVSEQYHFVGWSLNQTTILEEGYIITLRSDMNVYAMFSEQTPITVTLDPNGGTVSPETIVVFKNMTYGYLPTPTRANYSFTGWYTAQTGGTLVTSDTIVTSPTNHFLYAHWVQATLNGYWVDRNGNEITNVAIFKGQTLDVQMKSDLNISFIDGRIQFAPNGIATASGSQPDLHTIAITIEGVSEGLTQMTVRYSDATLPTVYISNALTITILDTPDVWWDNGYVNGSATIAFNYGDTMSIKDHIILIPLLEYDGIKKNGNGIDYFHSTNYYIKITMSFPRVTALIEIYDGMDLAEPAKTFTLGTWPQFEMTIDAQNSQIIFSGIGKKTNSNFSFMDYNTVYSEVAYDFSHIVNNLAFKKVYHEDQGNKEGHIHFQVMSTTTYLDTYGYVMIDPSLNIYPKFPDFNNLRLNLYSFALYGETFTINGHTFNLNLSSIEDLYVQEVREPIYDRVEKQRAVGKDPETGKWIYETYYVDVLRGYKEYYVIANASDEGAKKLDLTLDNIYITWENINSYDTDNPRKCYLTFVNDNITIYMGTFNPNDPYHDMTISATGMWYFTTAVYEPYKSTETVYKMNWDSLFNLSANGFILIFIGCIIGILAIFTLALGWRLELYDWIVIIGAGVLAYFLLGAF